jgi:hypothetical protein
VLWVCVFAVLAIATLAPAAGQQPVPGPSSSPAPASTASAQSDPNDRQTGKQNSDAVNAGGRKLAIDESTELLRLATGLKAEVDKTNQDTLSLTVIRRAGEIERLAHAVREKAKLAAKANQGGGS